MADATIAEMMQERVRCSVSDQAEHQALLDRYNAAFVAPDTPESLREMVTVWARSEKLWNRVPDVPPPPPGFGPGTPAVAREGARLAA